MKRVKEKKDYESINAREWEEQSIAGRSEAGSQSQGPTTVTAAVTPASIIPNAAQGQRISPIDVVGTARDVDGDARAAGPRPAVSQQVPPYRRGAVPVKSTVWAEPPAIEKTKQKRDKEMREEHVRRENKYLGQPDTQEELPGTGFYIWPKGIDQIEDHCSNHPRDVFGANLEKLDLLRKVHRVYILWDNEIKCIKVLSKSSINAEDSIAATIKGIRQAVRNANAQAHHASPLYIIVPPNREMKSNVTVKSTKNGRSGGAAPIITGFQLSGKPLSEEEQKSWVATLEERQKTNFELFKGHLVNHTLRLAPLRGWMRMRVHFGHVNVVAYNKKKIESSGFNFDSLEELMGHSRTICNFDRRMDGNFATRLMKDIVNAPEIFCPKDATVFKLQDVVPKHTMVMFLRIKGLQMRVEAAIDHAPGFEESSGWEKGKHTVTYFKSGSYQMGTTYPYYNNKRNKRAEVTTVDIQRGFDWTMEIIEDGTYPEIPPSLLDLIETCVTNETKDRVDSLGLSYPGITPRKSPNLGIDEVHIRSVYDYVFTESQYVTEIAIYRSWKGCDVVSRDPEIQTSVSLYHRVWDEETASIENTTYERSWDRDLKCFFEQKYQIGGIEGFLDHVVFIQDMLGTAEKDGRRGPPAAEPTPVR